MPEIYNFPFSNTMRTPSASLPNRERRVEACPPGTLVAVNVNGLGNFNIMSRHEHALQEPTLLSQDPSLRVVVYTPENEKGLSQRRPSSLAARPTHSWLRAWWVENATPVRPSSSS